MISLVLRNLVSVAVLPGIVLVGVPFWIAREMGTVFELPNTPLSMTTVTTGLFIGAAGASLFLLSLFRFGTEGKGTLAPWDPPRNLVVRGPYAYVRHPMISGVVLLLFAEALMLRSPPHAGWATLFLLISAIHIPLFEEPLLRSKFGADYERYADNVPLLVPRLRPWHDPQARRDAI